MSHWKKYDGLDWWRSMWTGVFWFVVGAVDLMAMNYWWNPTTIVMVWVRGSMMISLEILLSLVWWAILARKRQQYPFGLPPLSHFWGEFKWHIQIWWMWKVTGWPFKQRCPRCAGDGTYVSETQARYDSYDGDDTCPMCQGKGLIKRQ